MKKTTAQIKCCVLIQTTLTPISTYICTGRDFVWWRFLVYQSCGLRVEVVLAVAVAFVDGDPPSNYCGQLANSHLVHCGLAALLLKRAGAGTAVMAAYAHSNHCGLLVGSALLPAP